MKKYKYIILLVFLGIANQLKAKELFSLQNRFDQISIGIGFGLDYGGIGGNILYYPHKNLGIFGGLGYAFADLGVNAGAKVRLISEKYILSPYLIGMYGYNAVIIIANASRLNKTFYGPTIGVGLDLDFKSGPRNIGYWSLALLVPIRSAEVGDYKNDLKNKYGVVFNKDFAPVTLSIGYRFILS